MSVVASTEMLTFCAQAAAGSKRKMRTARVANLCGSWLECGIEHEADALSHSTGRGARRAGSSQRAESRPRAGALRDLQNIAGRYHRQAVRDRSAGDGAELRGPGARNTVVERSQDAPNGEAAAVSQYDVSPRDPGLHDSRRRPDRHGHGRDRLHHRGRVRADTEVRSTRPGG